MLEYRNITVETKKEKILDGLSMTVPNGAVLCITGPDQRAKSLLLDLAAGCLIPDEGEVLLDGEPVSENLKKFYSRIGYMTSPDEISQDLTVYEYYEMILALYKIRGRNRRKRIEESLDCLSLTGYENSFAAELPAQKIPLFRLGKALLHEPDWVFLDQPFSGLDAEGRAEIVTVLLNLHDKGVSIVLNSEMYPDLRGFITDIAVIEDGKPGICGQIEEVYEDLLRTSPVTMLVLSNMEAALRVLKRTPLVDRVTVKDAEVLFQFRGEEREEADLLAELIREGAKIQSYTRDRVRINEMFRG